MINNKTVKVCLVAILVTFMSLIPIDNSLPLDDGPPYTGIYYEEETGVVTLYAFDTLGDGETIDSPCFGIKATYYEIDEGVTITYYEPFKLPEGTHTLFFWSEDLCGTLGDIRTATLTYDTTPPTVEIIVPEQGKLYIFGSPLMNRLYGEKTLMIGKTPIEVEADDADGTGVSMVLFNIGNDSGYDFEPPYTYEFTNMKFGEITISARAIDNKGLVSEPVEMKVIVFGLGLME